MEDNDAISHRPTNLREDLVTYTGTFSLKILRRITIVGCSTTTVPLHDVKAKRTMSTSIESAQKLKHSSSRTREAAFVALLVFVASMEPYNEAIRGPRGQRKTGKLLPHSALSGYEDVSASLHVSSTLRMDRLWSGFGFRSREQKVAKSFSIAVVLSGSYVPGFFDLLNSTVHSGGLTYPVEWIVNYLA